MKTLFATSVAAAALIAGAASAQAESPADIFDSCKPHDWLAYGEAVETADYAALDAMLRDPELHGCPMIVASARALVCANDPLACIEPAAGVVDLPYQYVGTNPDENDTIDPDYPYNLLPGQTNGVSAVLAPHDDDSPGEEIEPIELEYEYVGGSLPYDYVGGNQGEYEPVPPSLPYTCNTCEGFAPFQGQGPFPNQAPGEAYGGSRDHAQPASGTMAGPSSGPSSAPPSRSTDTSIGDSAG